MKDNNNIYELITKDLTSSASNEEKLALKEELMLNAEFRKKYTILSSFWKTFPPVVKKHNIIEKTEKKLGYTIEKKRIKFSFLLKVAATLLLILSVGYSTYHIIKPSDEIILNEYVCENGDVREIHLTDGTKVWLNSSSILIASEPFKGDKREVILVGEGYFEVAKNEELPFIVNTFKMKTRVLGTHFNINAYYNEPEQITSLYEGSVMIESMNGSNENALLSAGYEARLDNDNGEIQISKNEFSTPAIWRDGVLRFYNEDLASISRKLERKFETKIMLSNKEAANLRFTANFETESLTQILDLLIGAVKETQPFSYYETEDGIFIVKRS